MRLTLASFLVACLVGGAFAFGPLRGAAVLAPSGGVASPSILPAFAPQTTVSTVPSNGDVNPYGVAFVPAGFNKGTPNLNPGDVLVSNFNNQMNQQGTGTSIIRIKPDGTTSLFFQGNPFLGLSTAFGILQSGLILAGNVPTMDGACGTLLPGSLLVLNANGQVVRTLTNANLLDSPWDLTIVDQGSTAIVFISNVLSGTVTRMNLTGLDASGRFKVQSLTRIASGYTHSCTQAAFVIGPTGLAYDQRKDRLYVASTGDNMVFAIEGASHAQDAGTGRVIYADALHLHGPLVLLLVPNGHLLVSNGDAVNTDPNQPSEIVEFTVNGNFVNQISVDPNVGGAFGMNIEPIGSGAFRFAAVDDNAVTLSIWTLFTLL